MHVSPTEPARNLYNYTDKGKLFVTPLHKWQITNPAMIYSSNLITFFCLICFVFFLQLQMSHKQESRAGGDSKAKLNAGIFWGGGGVYSLLSFHK